MKITLKDFIKDFTSNIKVTEDEFNSFYPFYEEASFDEVKTRMAERIFRIDCGMCDDYINADKYDFVDSEADYDGDLSEEINTIGDSLNQYISCATQAFIDEFDSYYSDYIEENHLEKYIRRKAIERKAELLFPGRFVQVYEGIQELRGTLYCNCMDDYEGTTDEYISEFLEMHNNSDYIIVVDKQ